MIDASNQGTCVLGQGSQRAHHFLCGRRIVVPAFVVSRRRDNGVDPDQHYRQTKIALEFGCRLIRYDA